MNMAVRSDHAIGRPQPPTLGLPGPRGPAASPPLPPTTQDVLLLPRGFLVVLRPRCPAPAWAAPPGSGTPTPTPTPWMVLPQGDLFSALHVADSPRSQPTAAPQPRGPRFSRVVGGPALPGQARLSVLPQPCVWPQNSAGTAKGRGARVPALGRWQAWALAGAGPRSLTVLTAAALGGMANRPSFTHGKPRRQVGLGQSSPSAFLGHHRPQRGQLLSKPMDATHPIPTWPLHLSRGTNRQVLLGHLIGAFDQASFPLQLLPAPQPALPTSLCPCVSISLSLPEALLSPFYPGSRP